MLLSPRTSGRAEICRHATAEGYPGQRILALTRLRSPPRDWATPPSIVNKAQRLDLRAPVGAAALGLLVLSRASCMRLWRLLLSLLMLTFGRGPQDRRAPENDDPVTAHAVLPAGQPGGSDAH